MAQTDIIRSIRQSIGTGKQRFEAIVAKDKSDLNWGSETMFAMQVIEKSKYLQQCTLSSLKGSVVNVAAIGLTLNPAEKLAYLIPRKRRYKEGKQWMEVWEACLDISYRGLVKIATDAGSIRWAKAEIVRKEDEFIWHGIDQKPTHNITNPFGNEEQRGEIIGAYCVAKTSDGDYLCDIMSIDEIYKIRDRSDAWKFGEKGKRGPWESDEGQMIKKTLIRRGSVSWPLSTRFMLAEAELNKHQGISFDETAAEPDREQELLVNDEQVKELNDLIEKSGIKPERIFKVFKIESIDQLAVSKFADCKQRIKEYQHNKELAAQKPKPEPTK